MYIRTCFLYNFSLICCTVNKENNKKLCLYFLCSSSETMRKQHLQVPTLVFNTVNKHLTIIEYRKQPHTTIEYRKPAW